MNVGASNISAASLGLARCGGCEQLSRARAVPAGHTAHCGRCGTRIQLRKPHATERTWALLLTAYAFYSLTSHFIPAQICLACACRTIPAIPAHPAHYQ